jgi:hypothetical protein
LCVPARVERAVGATPRRARGRGSGQGWELTRRRRLRSGNAVSCGMSLFHGIATAVLSGREARRLPQSVPALGQGCTFRAC